MTSHKNTLYYEQHYTLTQHSVYIEMTAVITALYMNNTTGIALHWHCDQDERHIIFTAID